MQVSVNATGEPNASSLHYPSGVWSDGQKIIVADAWNHRVLVWHTFPQRHGQPADTVIGQQNFSSVLPNINGVGALPTQQTTYWSYGIYSDGKSLWIADTGNRRILNYNTIPTKNYASADRVIGKPDFTTKDYINREPVWPYSVRLNSRGIMSVSDTQFYRILLWYAPSTHPNPNLIIGQPDFSSNGQNQFQLQPNECTLNWTYDTYFYREGLFVCDTGNSRILWYSQIPTRHNPSANAVIGKRDFKTNSENKDTQIGTDNSLYWPFALAMMNDTMVIADTGNHRILFLKLDLNSLANDSLASCLSSEA